MLRPLGSRLLVKPDPPATMIGGILVPASAEKPPAMTGTVIALGRGPASAHRVRQDTLAEVREAFEAIGFTVVADKALARLMPIDLHDVAVGDWVCFAFTAGTNLTINGELFILLEEDDIEAVWTPHVADIAGAA